jgi:hypothetical protein
MSTINVMKMTCEHFKLLLRTKEKGQGCPTIFLQGCYECPVFLYDKKKKCGVNSLAISVERVNKILKRLEKNDPILYFEMLLLSLEVK